MLVPARSLALLPSFRPAAFLALVLTAAAASAQTVKLSGPLARPIGSDIQTFQLDAQGKRVVYVADQEQDGVFELFSVEPGQAAIHLSAPLPPNGDVASFQLAPDGRTVAYTTGFPEYGLFSVPAGGGPVLRLDGPPMLRVSPFQLQIDSTSSRVVFQAELSNSVRADLFSVPLDGSAPAVRLSRADGVQRPMIGADRVVFQVSLFPTGSTAIFSAPLDGSREPVQLSPFLSGNAWTFELTPDGRRTFYLNAGLISVASDGRGSPVNLSGGSVGPYRLSPDSLRAVYSNSRGRLFSVSVFGDEAPLPLESLTGAGTPQDLEIDAEGARVVFTRAARLYHVPILGGPQPAEISSHGRVIQFQLAPEKRVVFLENVDPSTPELELRSALVGSNEPAVDLASPRLLGDAGVLVAGKNVVYRARTDVPEFQLFSVPADGSQPARRMSDPPSPGREVRLGFAASADGSSIAYLADRDFDEVNELFLAPADANVAPVKLNPPFPLGRVEGDVMAARFSLDGTRAVYRADAREDEVFELFSVGAAGGAVPVQLNQPLVFGGDVQQFDVAPAHVVYLADQDVNDVAELFSVPLDGGPSVRLETVPTTVRGFQLSPDRSRAVFQVDENGDFHLELYSVPVDGSALATQLTSSAGAFKMTLASARGVFAGDPDHDLADDLFSVPIAGGPLTRLSDPAPPDRFFREYQLTADGLRVLYRLQTSAPSKIALFSVPIDGSASPLELSAALPATTLVTSFALSPDGARVVFGADAVVTGVYELFSMPVDGSAGPLRLHTANAARPEITPDGTRVVFLVPTTLPSYELHAVPLDASAPPVVLSGALRYDTSSASSLQSAFRLSPDSHDVVFRAAKRVDVFRLFGVPIDGSSPPVGLSRTNQKDATVHDDYRITPDGSTVLYRLTGFSSFDFGSRLFHVQLHDPRLPQRISGPSVYSFDLSPDGQRVLHRTTRDDPGIIELYASGLTRTPHVLPR